MNFIERLQNMQSGELSKFERNSHFSLEKLNFETKKTVSKIKANYIDYRMLIVNKILYLFKIDNNNIIDIKELEIKKLDRYINKILK